MNKCVEFCHALATSEKKFTFTLKIETETLKFNTSLKSSDLELKNPTVMKKKKKSPSQLRREARRKEQRNQKKESGVAAEEAASNKTLSEDQHHKCNICDKFFNTESGLKIHKGKAHRVERLRSSSNPHESPLKVSPGKDSQREEPVEGIDLSPAKETQGEEKQDEEDKNSTDSQTDNDDSDEEEDYVKRLGPRGWLAQVAARRGRI